jgi:hypothetical protein
MTQSARQPVPRIATPQYRATSKSILDALLEKK